MNPVSIREMLECGVHFGHPTRRWNPKMKRYIFGERNGISIIDLQKTARLAKKALEYARGVAANGGKVLFVGTKRQSADVVEEQANRSNCYFVNHRWLGGLMTNFATISNSIRKLKDLDEMMGDERRLVGRTKKEIGRLEKQRQRLERDLRGIKDMRGLPAAVFVVDVMKEHIAVAEANKLEIPVIAVVDSNCDPDPIDYIIPANDDAIRSIKYFSEKLADAVIEGEKIHKAKKAEEEARRKEERARVEKQRDEERKKREKERKEKEAAAKAKKTAEAVKKQDEAAKPAAAEEKKEAKPDPAKKPARAKKKEAPKAEAKAEEKPAKEKKAESKKAAPKKAEEKTEAKAKPKAAAKKAEEKPKKEEKKAEKKAADKPKKAAPKKADDKKADDKKKAAKSKSADKKADDSESKEKK